MGTCLNRCSFSLRGYATFGCKCSSCTSCMDILSLSNQMRPRPVIHVARPRKTGGNGPN